MSAPYGMTDNQYNRVVNEINALRGQPLYVLFRRRNAKMGKKGVVLEPAGTIRGMKCQFTGNNARVTEDDKVHRCLTVWCLEKGGEGFKRIPLDPHHLMHFSLYSEEIHGKLPAVRIVNRDQKAAQQSVQVSPRRGRRSNPSAQGPKPKLRRGPRSAG